MSARGYWDTTIDTPDSLDLLEGSTLDDRPTADMRRGAAWRAALVRLDIQDGQRFGDHERRLRYHRFTNSGASTWMLNRASGVALVPCDPDEGSVLNSYESAAQRLAFRLEWERRSNAQRDRMTREVCVLVASAMVNTADMIAEDAHAGASIAHRRAAQDDCFPGYTRIRNYLANECEAEWWLACAVAFEFAASNAKYEQRRGHGYGGERGWI